MGINLYFILVNKVKVKPIEYILIKMLKHIQKRLLKEIKNVNI